MMKCETAVLQHEGEMREFINIIREENVRSYLEIGSKFGGSLWRIVNDAFPVGSRVAVIDLPQGDTSFKNTKPHLEECVATLAKRGYETHLFFGDSTSPEAVEFAKNLAPFDLCFIDANHTEKYVWHDWRTYGPMARIVAFHDIGWIARPEPSKKMPIEVPIVWNQIKSDYRHVEIKRCPRDNGIGVLWRS